MLDKTRPGVSDLTEQAFTRHGVLTDMGLTWRAPQGQYARLVAETLECGRDPAKGTAIRLLEGETGTGKTLGYLVPLLLHAVLQHKRVGVAVHSLQLQTQLWGQAALAESRAPDFEHDGMRSDLAVALEVVRRLTGERVEVCFRRGMANYVSVSTARRVIAECRKGPSARRGADRRAQAATLDAFETWVDAVEAGEEAAGHGLLAHAPDCPGGIRASDLAICSDEARDNSHGNPFFAASRIGSRHAQFVCHTHVLAVINAMSWHALLEGKDAGDAPLEVVLFDEADRLPGSADLVSRRHIQPARIRRLIEKISVHDDSWASAPLFADTLKLLDVVDAWFEQVHEDNGDDACRAILLDEPEAEALRKAAADHARELAECCRKIAGVCEQTPAIAEHAESFAGWAAGLRGIARISDSAPTQDGEVPHNKDACSIPSLSWSPEFARPSFGLTDLFPARHLGPHWAYSNDGTLKSHTESVLFTSATLCGHEGRNPWQGMEEDLGIYKQRNNILKGKRIEAGDAYGKITAFFQADPEVPKPVVWQTSDEDSDGQQGSYCPNPKWAAMVAATLKYLLDDPSRKGRFVCLTPSYRDVAMIREIYEDRHGTGSARIAWHDERGREALDRHLDAWRQGHCEGIVSPTLWQGHNLRQIDGSQLMSDLVIARLPIAPLDSARTQALQRHVITRGRSLEYAKGVIWSSSRRNTYGKFRQGFGRLIRDEQDEGRIWILDRRFPFHRRALQCDSSLQPTSGHFDFLGQAIPERFQRARYAAAQVLSWDEHAQRLSVRPIKQLLYSI